MALVYLHSVSVDPEPDAVRFTFSTTEPAQPLITIYEYRVSKKTGALAFDSADEITHVRAGSIRGALGVTSKDFDVRVPGLPQDTHVMFQIDVGTDRVEGEVRTGTRWAEYSIPKIHLIDDGDPGGSGELTWALAVYDERGNLAGEASFYRDWDPGYYNGPFFEPIAIPNAGRAYRVLIELTDDDTTPGLAHFEAAPDRSTAPPEGVRHDNNSDHDRTSIVTPLVRLPSDAGRVEVPVVADTGPGKVAFVATGKFTAFVTVPDPFVIRHSPPEVGPRVDEHQQTIPPITLKDPPRPVDPAHLKKIPPLHL